MKPCWKTAFGQDRGDKGKAMLSVADFNCPGEKYHAARRRKYRYAMTRTNPKAPLPFKRYLLQGFTMNGILCLENYIYGANDPEIIDSVARLHLASPMKLQKKKRRRWVPSRSTGMVKAVPKNDPSIAAYSAADLVAKEKSRCGRCRLLLQRNRSIHAREKNWLLLFLSPAMV